MPYGLITQRALEAAKHAPNVAAGKCPKCDKFGLALLVVRPGLADKRYADSVHGSIEPLLKGTADVPLTDAGYCLRSLRGGYLQAFYEKPLVRIDAAAQGGWSIDRVDAGGYLTPTTYDREVPGGIHQAEPFACSRTAAYAQAALFVIPDAKRAGKVWIAFSSHPWSETVRKAYAGSTALRDQYMTCIDTDAMSCSRSLSLTVENIQQAVADFTPSLDPAVLEGNPFPRKPLADDDDAVQRALRLAPFLRKVADQSFRHDDAAAVHEQAGVVMREGGFAPEQALIVSVADPEGVTTEAAQRRITLCHTANEWVAGFKDDKGQPNGYWRLQSAYAVRGLLKLMATPAAKDAAEHARYDPSLNLTTMDRATFERYQREGKLPSDAALVTTDFNETRMGQHPIDRHPAYGRVVMPTPDAIRRASVARMTTILEKLDGKARGLNWERFLETYEKKAKADQARLAQVEQDYRAWLDSAARKHLTSHDFDERDRADGLAYAECVNNLTLGGPITDNGMAWFKPLLGEDPTRKEAILTRALLGNQADFFGWFGERDQQTKSLDELKGILDLDDVQRAKETLAHKAAAWSDMLKRRDYVAQALIVTANATSAGLLKTGQLSDAFSRRLQTLARMLVAKSANTGKDAAQLLKLQVPYSVGTHLWHAMLDVREQMFPGAAQAGSRPVRSLLLSPASMLETLTGRSHADVLMEVYVLARGWPSDSLQQAMGRGHYALAADGLATEGPWAKVATKIDLEGARELAKQSMRVLKEGSGVLSAGSAWLNLLAGVEAVQKFQRGTAEDRRNAAMSFVSSGLSVSAALLEVRGAFAKAAEKELVEKGIRRAAGYASGVGLIVDAAVALVSGMGELKQGGAEAGYAHLAQFTLFLGAGAATVISGVAAAESGSVLAGTFLGLSASGWGLLLVALGMIAGFVAVVLKDTPAQTWAAESIWGAASNRFSSLEREQSGLNSVLMGAQINFNYRSALADATNWSQGNWGTAEMTGAFDPAASIQTREAWLQVILPKAVMDGARWRMRIKAGRGRATELIASRGSDGVSVGTEEAPAKGIMSITYHTESLGGEESVAGKEGSEGAAGAASVVLTLSAKLDAFAYSVAEGFVEIYASNEADADLLVDETMRDL